MNFLQKVWAAIKKILGSVNKTTEANAEKAIRLVENMKTFVFSPGADVITALIPGDWDNKFKEKVKLHLPSILVQLNATADCIGIQNQNDRMICAIKSIRSLTGDARNAFLLNTAVMFLRVLEDGKVTWSDAVLVIQYIKENKFK